MYFPKIFRLSRRPEPFPDRVKFLHRRRFSPPTCPPRGSRQRKVGRSTHHAVPRADRPEPRLEGPAEELAQVTVVSQLPVLGLLKVAAEGPGEEAQHGPPQPHGQGNVVGPAPPAGGHAQGQHPVEADLRRGSVSVLAREAGRRMPPQRYHLEDEVSGFPPPTSSLADPPLTKDNSEPYLQTMAT